MIPMTKERQEGTWSFKEHGELLHKLFAEYCANPEKGADPEKTGKEDTKYMRQVREDNKEFHFCKPANFYVHYRKEALDFLENKMKTGQPRNTGGASTVAAGCTSALAVVGGGGGGGGSAGSHVAKKRRAEIDTISKW
jgi:hypothetical protein